MGKSIVNILDFTLSQLQSWIVSSGFPRYNAEIIFKWLYNKRVYDFDRMTDLSKKLRQILKDQFLIQFPRVLDVKEGPDGTKKYLYELADGEKVESVFIPEEDRITLCLSTQVGCRMGCAFCVTALSGLRRNLTPGEIVAQVLIMTEGYRGRTNIVLMGMGEPLDNFQNTVAALDIIVNGIGISPRRITVSTVGLLDRLKQLFNLPFQPKIAISLNATTEEVRSELMPVNRKYPVKAIVETLKELPVRKRDRITIEYVLIKGINSAPEDAERLARLLKGLRVKINLIPYNESPYLPYKRPSEESIEKFAEILRKHHYSVFIRKSRGNEIQAACGQLRASWSQGS